jgi:hypothetical protein
MELIKLDNISAYKFGVVEETDGKEETVLQHNNKLYILTEDDEIDLITIKSLNKSVFEINSDIEVELDANILYYLKCKKLYNSPEFTIKKYKKLKKTTNLKCGINQFKFSKERFYDIFSSYIENKNVLLSYWIFPHININKFLKNIRIPYKLIFEKNNHFCNLGLENIGLYTNSILFSNLKNINLKIETLAESFHTSADGGFATMNIAYKEVKVKTTMTEKCCYVVFNPKLPSEKILDLKDLSIIFPINETTDETVTIEL